MRGARSAGAWCDFSPVGIERASTVRRRRTPNIFKLHLSFHKTPWATASLSEKVVQYIG